LKEENDRAELDKKGVLAVFDKPVDRLKTRPVAVTAKLVSKPVVLTITKVLGDVSPTDSQSDSEGRARLPSTGMRMGRSPVRDRWASRRVPLLPPQHKSVREGGVVLLTCSLSG